MMKYDGAKTIISLFLMKARWTDRPTDRQTDCSMDGPMEGPSQGDACIYLNMFSLPCFLWGRTERDNLQGEEGLKSLATPYSPNGAIEPLFGLGIHQRDRTGVTVAVFEFPSRTPKNRPPRAHWGWGP